jgi:dihydrofolate reductase
MSTKKPIISMIAAVAEDRAIGYKNKLLWHIPEDLAHFKKITLGHPVIMGRNTFFSLGRPLPGRKNIVLTLEPGEVFEGATASYDIQAALDEAGVSDHEEIFIIGGAAVYKALLPYADRLYLTIVPGEYQADTYFPEYSDFSRIVSEESLETSIGTLQFLTLEKE